MANGISGETITIQSGQTLSQIAEEYGVTVADIQKANNLKGTNIMAGKNLIIPAPEPKFDNGFTNSKLDEMEFTKEEREANAEYSQEKIAISNHTNKDLKAQIANLTVNKKSGYVQINVKKDITIKELKELYNIPDGILKNYNDLSYEWQDNNDENHTQRKNWDVTTFFPGDIVIVPPGSFEYQGWIIELYNAFTR